MPFPTDWPPRHPSGRRSLRVFLTGMASVVFEDNAYLFHSVVSANPFMPTPESRPETPVAYFNATMPSSPLGTGRVYSEAPVPPHPAPMIWANTILIRAEGGPIEFSFDGINVHGYVPPGQDRIYRNRHEAGIALRGAGSTFYVEAW